MPVMTSSAMRSTPCRRQISATDCKYPGGGTTAPSVAPLSGSKMKAAASPVAAAMAWSSSAADCWAAAVSADGQRAQRGAVVALFAAEDLVAARLSDFDLILAREFERGLD